MLERILLTQAHHMSRRQPDMNMRVLMRSTGAVTVVVARPVTMEAPKWVEKLSPMPVVLIHHCFAWSYDAHCVAVKAAALSCTGIPP